VRDLLILLGGLRVAGVVVASRLPPILRLLRLSSVPVAVAPLEWVGDRFGRPGRGRVAVALCAVAVDVADLHEAGSLEVRGRDADAPAELAQRAASVPTDGMDLWLRRR
jgi:hypothetical protein